MNRTNQRRYALKAITLGLAATTLACVAHAAPNWPSKPIRLIVAGPAGGSADMLARVLADGLHESLGTAVIVESKPGASGAIAINDLKSNGKDGYTFLVIQSGAVTEVPLAYKVNYKPFSDLRPLAQISRTALVLVANKDKSLNNLQDVIKFGQAQKDGVDFASYATGMRGHTSGILLGQLTKMNMRYIGYKGSPPALVDLMGAQFPLMFDGVSTSFPLIKSGKITPIAVSYPTRVAMLPDVPTFKELGYPQLSKAGWFAVWSNPQTPPEIQAKLRDATLAYMKKPEAQTRIQAIGMEMPEPWTQAEMDADLKDAYQQQEALLKSINYQPE